MVLYECIRLNEQHLSSKNMDFKLELFSLTLLKRRFLQKLSKPSEILFIDDSLSHVDAAAELGIITHHYRNLETFQQMSAL
jgi:hypothetical protein